MVLHVPTYPLNLRQLPIKRVSLEFAKGTRASLTRASLAPPYYASLCSLVAAEFGTKEAVTTVELGYGTPKAYLEKTIGVWTDGR